jgi:hypothetical protein
MTVSVVMVVSSLVFPAFKLDGNVLALKVTAPPPYVLCFCLFDKLQTLDLGAPIFNLKDNASFQRKLNKGSRGVRRRWVGWAVAHPRFENSLLLPLSAV